LVSLEEAAATHAQPKPLTGRVALVTGSAGGIGKAIAKSSAGAGRLCVVIKRH